MADAFFAWARANEIPFFAILMAIVGTLVAGAVAALAGTDLLIRTYRKLKSR